MEQLTYFSKIMENLENIELKLKNEDKALLLLNTFPNTFEHFKNNLLFRKT